MIKLEQRNLIIKFIFRKFLVLYFFHILPEIRSMIIRRKVEICNNVTFQIFCYVGWKNNNFCLNVLVAFESCFSQSRCYVRQFFLRQFFHFSSTIQEWVVFRPCFCTCHWSKSELIEVKQDNI